MENQYVGLDGDGIGRVIESMLIRNKVQEVVAFSQSIVAALENIKKKVELEGGNVLFCSGDSILFHGQFDVDFCDRILKEFHVQTTKTASIGIGNTLAEAYLGLKLAKSSGGNKTEIYSI